MHLKWLVIFTDADSFQLVPPKISQHELSDDKIWSTVLKTRSSGVHTPPHTQWIDVVNNYDNTKLHRVHSLFPLSLVSPLCWCLEHSVYVCVLFSVCMYMH